MRSGKYINQLKDDARYKAFVPDALPFKIEVDEDLQSLLSKADLALGRLDGIAETLPDVDFFILMYIRKEATLSSQVEGTQATFADVLNAEAKIEDLEIRKDVDEILNYIDAMNYGLKRLKTFPLSLRLIKEIHKILLRGVRGEYKEPGEFKKSQNWVGGTTIERASFVPCPPQEVMSALYNMEKFLHNNSRLPVLIKTGLIHSQFENIHPFLDGNGRIGRLLITFYLCQQKALDKPLLYLSEFFKKYRQEYYDRLNAVHEKDDIESWLKFFLEGIAVTANQAVDTSKKIIKLKDEDTKKILSLGRSASKATLVFNSLFHTPTLTVKAVEKITGLKNPNALLLVSKMIKMGILKEITGRKRNKVFRYQNYVNLFD
ncbi:MAG: cell filamentation protein Fic [Candidatus Staskawiczbacteria bacterium RIFCSPHIGHO2_01_FULL_36_16]|uniref:Cell filamentation protein Fic n=1 Tax=Candidatus Staskawiczbacteria bacterium RIFCSPHIGHO2_01_FULL_36_16 TaxID=1802200 RepID=A0A1G2HPZ9_9BACT|nr:MAG: cell filamentation protein Fic [Candidatus Staskawiczbacteria bacterium RIFCSPHIGHO2_01_FULL_36_16]